MTGPITGRRSLLAALLGLALLGAPAALLAQDPADAIVAQLEAQGYVSFDVSRTLLGRVQVIATGPGGTREIVFNPATGEILRDYLEASDGARGPNVIDRADDDPGRQRGGGSDASAPAPPRGGSGDDGGGGGDEGSGGNDEDEGGSGGGSGSGSGGGSGGAAGGGGRGGGAGGGGDGNRGHGNDADGSDDGNPGRGRGQGG